MIGRWYGVLNRNVMALVTEMTSAFVDDSGSASFVSQLILDSGMVNAIMADSPPCLMDPFANTVI